MGLNKIIKEIKDSSGQESILSRDSIVIIFFRWLSFYTTPIFIFLKVSANLVTTFSLLFGIVAAILICLNNLYIGYLFYFISVLFDHIDGNIARYKGQSTFFGRFIDGFFGIVIISFLHISFAFFLSNNSNNEILPWVAILVAVLTPMHHLFYDRYSTFVRWIKEEGQKIETLPYIRSNMSWSFYLSDNLQKILLYVWPFLFYYNFYWELCILIYLVLNIFLALSTLIKHTLAAKKNFSLSAKSHRS